MLNLSRQEDMLTQGQSPAERVLANPSQGSSEGGQPGVSPAGVAQIPASGGNPTPAPPDVLAIARQVYELMRQDLLIMNERSGPGR